MQSENTCLLAVVPITNCPVSILDILKFLNIVKLYFSLKWRSADRQFKKQSRTRKLCVLLKIRKLVYTKRNLCTQAQMQRDVPVYLSVTHFVGCIILTMFLCCRT